MSFNCRTRSICAARCAWSGEVRWLLVASLSLAPLLGRAEVRRFALVVGSNVGDGVNAAPLRYADDDAVAMHELLSEAGVESVLLAEPDDNTQRLHPAAVVTGPPTLARLTEVLEAQRAEMRFAKAAGAEVEWIFFFSGHGDVEGGEGFLGLSRGRLTRAFLHDALRTTPADRSHVLIDACKSGLMVAGKGPGGRRVPFPSSFSADAAQEASVGFIVSASSSRDSHEWERFQAGVFSYELRSGLRGAADADGDGVISYAELGAFLQAANQGIASAQHRPDFVVLPPRGGEGMAGALLRWPGAPAVVVDAWLGHVYVERPNGDRVLDLHAAVGFAAGLLPAERPLFLRTADEGKELALLQPVEHLAAVAPTVPASRAKGALSLAMDHLFAVPFDAGVVASFRQGWQVPDWNSLEVTAELPPLQRLRPVAGWVTLGAGAVGVASLGVAWQARVPRNAEISAFNAVGVVCLGVSAAALVAWVLFGWNPTGLKLGSSVDGGADLSFGFELP